MSSSRLPAPLPNQTYVTVSPIGDQSFTLPENSFVKPAEDDARRTVPSLSFLIIHPNSPSTLPWLDKHTPSPPLGHPLRLLFDLGLRKSANAYSPQQQQHLKKREPHELSTSVAEVLSQKGDVTPQDIDLVILSHVHYDHHGDPSDFPSAHFLVGPGSLKVLHEGLGGTASHQHFDPELLPHDRTIELPFLVSSAPTSVSPSASAWKPLGHFTAALDLFGDESVFVISAPGHLPGHVNLLCRVMMGKWVYLAGDAAHDVRLLTGEKGIGTWVDEGGTECCIHVDKVEAEDTIERIRKMMESEGEGVEVVLAHDEVWKAGNGWRLYPGCM